MLTDMVPQIIDNDIPVFTGFHQCGLERLKSGHILILHRCYLRFMNFCQQVARRPQFIQQSYPLCAAHERRLKEWTIIEWAGRW